MALLKELTRKTIMTEVICGMGSSSTPGELEWRVLVVDQQSMRIISACCSMHDVTAEGITIVEDINKEREPLPFLDAIYFISPCEGSIDKMLKDMSSTLYQGYYIYFTEVCDEKLFDKLCLSNHSKKVKALKEINISFLPVESNVFSLDYPHALKHVYGASSSESDRALEKIAGQIATLCATLGEYPAIRYRSACAKNFKLAELTGKILKEYKENGNSMGEGAEKARSQLVILDRGFDCITPFLHELTFQAMIYDILKIEDNVYKYESSTGEKTIVLDENDERWLELRHKHISEVYKSVSENVKTFVESKTKTRSENKSSVKDLALMMKKMPQYQKECTNLTNHINLAEEIQKRWSRIQKLCELEQNLAIGVNDEGERINDHKGQLNPILLTDGITPNEKLRIMILYILNNNGVTEAYLNKLIQHADINEDLRDIVTNVSLLGHNIIVNDNNPKEISHVERRDRSAESRYNYSRWTPALKDILEDIIESKINERSFPFIPGRSVATGYKAPTSARLGNWHIQVKPGASAKKRPRLIIFITGGVTYSEMRTVYEINKAFNDWEVVIGSTQIITPNTFLDSVKDITRTEE